MRLEVGKTYEVVDNSIFEGEQLFTVDGAPIENGYKFIISNIGDEHSVLSKDFSFFIFGNGEYYIPVYDRTLQDGKVREVV